MKATSSIFGKVFSGITIMVALFGASSFASAEQVHQPSNRTVEYIAPQPALPEVPPGFAGVGPVISGSVEYSAIPSKARKFLEKHCDGHAVIKCQKEYNSGTFNVGLADGIEMKIETKGKLIGI